MDSPECLAVWCGTVSYGKALHLQKKISGLKKLGMPEDVLLLLEHSPVITLGRSADRKNLLVSEDLLAKRGVELYETDRGGDITFHGPGQLVGYPILELRQGERDVRGYMRRLEESILRLLEGFGIPGRRCEGYPGVWTESGKIAAMGVHISRWITRHGFALNIETNLSYFDMIVPCGLAGKRVTSMKEETNAVFDSKSIAEKYVREFGRVYRRKMRPVPMEALNGELERFQAGAFALQSPAKEARARVQGETTGDSRDKPCDHTEDNLRRDPIRRA